MPTITDLLEEVAMWRRDMAALESGIKEDIGMLDKAIKHGKERRKPYYRLAKAICRECRNHGSDPWERDNRTYGSRHREPLITLDDIML